jgi:hypothetical protein
VAEPPERLDELAREISVTPAEYVRALNLAFPGNVTGGPLSFRAISGDVEVSFDLKVGPERRIALFRLPTLYVRIRFLSGSEAARRAVLRHMDLAMQKGGG